MLYLKGPREETPFAYISWFLIITAITFNIILMSYGKTDADQLANLLLTGLMKYSMRNNVYI